MKIGFTGSREGMTDKQKEAFADLLRHSAVIKNGIEEFHHGDCIGSDADAHKIAQEYANAVVIHPPANNAYRAFIGESEWVAPVILPPKDYLGRNHDIVAACDVLIATPKESHNVLRSGTWATIRYAEKIKKKVIIIWPSGNTETIG